MLRGMVPALLAAASCAVGALAMQDDEKAASASDPTKGGEAQTPLVLRRPALDAAATRLLPVDRGDSDREPTRLQALAFRFISPVYERPSRRRRPIGFVRRGRMLDVARPMSHRGCRGRWYEVWGGYVCSGDGFHVGTDPGPHYPQKRAADGEPLPYRYAMVTRDGALEYYRLPSADEEARALAAYEADQRLPDYVIDPMVGDYFLALDETEEGESGLFYRTIRGHYVRADDIEEQPAPQMSGELLDEQGLELPIAFVYGEERPVWRLQEGGAQQVGTAEKHARFALADEQEADGRTFAVSDEGWALSRDEVRIARRVARPPDIPPRTDWIHVDLSQQTLVAYEGLKPVFATLVASGKEGHDTPRGLFRIRLKYLSVRMQGDDPIDGPYSVSEVPWTMYYFRGYALHGAYWHDDFGKVRSHGCTNIAPVDARWLYYWTSPKVPEDWHGLRDRGTWVYFTRSDEDSSDS